MGVVAESAVKRLFIEVGIDVVGGGGRVCGSLCDVAVELLGPTSADDGCDDEETEDKSCDAHDGCKVARLQKVVQQIVTGLTEYACDRAFVLEETLTRGRYGGGCVGGTIGDGLDDSGWISNGSACWGGQAGTGIE